MENRTKFILITLVIFLVLIFVAYQQKMISDLKKEISAVGEKDSKNFESAAANSPFTVSAVQRALIENTKDIQGTLSAVNDETITVEAQIVDLSKLAGIEEAKLTGNVNSFPKIKKNYTVSVDDKTQYPSMGLRSMKIGIQVLIKTNDLVYQNDNLTASEIFVLSKGDASLKYQPEIKYIAGEIKEINNGYLTIEVNQIDRSKVADLANLDLQTAPKTTKSYKVIIDDKTQFVDNGLSELKIDDLIEAYSSDAVGRTSEFKATKIKGPIPILVPSELKK